MPGLPSELVERLYTTPPAAFVATRNQAAAEVRQSGDAATAKEISKLRKPTVAAWLVNLLALRRPDLVAGLVDLAAGLRAAQRELRGPRLRELSAQRRGAVNALVDQARSLAREVDPGVAAGKLPLAEVEATLNAALSDVEAAEQIRSGRLVRPVTYAGFGEVPRPKLQMVTEPTEPPARQRGPSKRGAKEESARQRAEAERREAERARRAEEAARAAQRRELGKELANARIQERRAESELARSVAAERDASCVLAEVEAELAELQRRRSAAEEEVSRRKAGRKAAEREAVMARRRTGEVQAAIEAFDAEGGEGPVQPQNQRRRADVSG